MTKKYQKPTMTVVKVQATSMLMTSPGQNGPVTTTNYIREDEYEE